MKQVWNQSIVWALDNFVEVEVFSIIIRESDNQINLVPLTEYTFRSYHDKAQWEEDAREEDVSDGEDSLHDRSGRFDPSLESHDSIHSL